MLPTPMFKIIRQEADWIIAEKPAPLLIHPTRPDGEPTFWNALQEEFPNESLCLMNRLDRETSGLVLISRNTVAASTLGKMVMARQIHKSYLALVAGEAPVAGVIDQPIGRKSDFEASDIYVLQIIHPEGKSAETHYRRIETRVYKGQPISLLEVELLTGRMHQIRVHLQSIGHSVIGDKLYGPDTSYYLRVVENGWSEDMKDRLYIRRQALHASNMEFQWQGTSISTHSSLPKDLLEFWNSCKPL